MDYNSNLVRFFILGSTLVDTLILIIITRRKLLREIPWFASYLVVDVLASAVSFYAYQSGNQWHYFYAAWANALLLALLSFLVIAEVFRNTVAQFDSVRRFGTDAFAVIACVLVILAIVIAPYGSSDLRSITTYLLLVVRSLRIVLVGLIVALFAIASFLGLTWKHRHFGIAIGFGLFAAADLACLTFAAGGGREVSYVVSLIDQAACLLSVVLWLSYFLKRDPKIIEFSAPSAKQDLEQWRSLLSDMKHQGFLGPVLK